MLKKIVIIGPESTGKSTLCKMLAKHYATSWCPEYARAYLNEHGTRYRFTDLLTIAKGQLALEDQYSETLNRQVTPDEFPLLFIDTDMQVMKVWCEYVFNDCHTWILNKAAERKYDLYLLCKPDLPWVHDEMREYPDEKPRLELFHIYRDALVHQHTPWLEIEGNYEERLQLAIRAVDRLVALASD